MDRKRLLKIESFDALKEYKKTSLSPFKKWTREQEMLWEMGFLHAQYLLKASEKIIENNKLIMSED